jgi:hypothetical protein
MDAMNYDSVLLALLVFIINLYAYALDFLIKIFLLDLLRPENNCWVGVCSIFLRVDRSTNEIYKPRALFLIKIFYKKYVFIYY